MNFIIIPARGGSKRIKNKNIKRFLGLPIIQQTINNLMKIKFKKRIIVSTDSKKIATIARKAGAEVPFIRPKSISGDSISTYDVMKHATDYLIKKNFKVDYVCCVYPTSVFVEKKYLLAGLNKIKTKRFDYIFSVKKADRSIEKFFGIEKNGEIKLFDPRFEFTRSQDLKNYFTDAAQFWWGKIEFWNEKRSIYNSKSGVITIPNWKVHDIDTIEDWKRAEVLMKSMKKKHNKNLKKNLKIISQIEKLRSKNNSNWMDIVRVALKHAPKESTKIVQGILSMDSKIQKVAKKLIE